MIEAEDKCLRADRTTGLGASPGPYTDKFGMLFTEGRTSKGIYACQITGCSESQVPSVMDFSTNFCNMYNLVCTEKEGCKSSLQQLGPLMEIKYAASCTHKGTPEHDAAQCRR